MKPSSGGPDRPMEDLANSIKMLRLRRVSADEGHALASWLRSMSSRHHVAQTSLVGRRGLGRSIARANSRGIVFDTQRQAQWVRATLVLRPAGRLFAGQALAQLGHHGANQAHRCQCSTTVVPSQCPMDSPRRTAPTVHGHLDARTAAPGSCLMPVGKSAPGRPAAPICPIALVGIPGREKPLVPVGAVVRHQIESSPRNPRSRAASSTRRLEVTEESGSTARGLVTSYP